MKSFLIVSTVAALALAASGLWQVFHPPFSGSQVAASIVDTWQAHAFVTAIVLVLLCFAACAAIVVRVLGGQHLGRLFYASLFSISAAFSAQLGSHIALTHQVTQVTGQTFGLMYGVL